MPRFSNLPVDWSTHTELNTDMLEQSAHGMKEQPEGCTCDFCAEKSFFGPKKSSTTARCTTNSLTAASATAYHVIHQFRLFVRERHKLMVEYLKLMDDWPFTQEEGENLQDFNDLRIRHCQLLKRLSDAGITQKYRNVNFSSLTTNAYE